MVLLRRRCGHRGDRLFAGELDPDGFADQALDLIHRIAFDRRLRPGGRHLAGRAEDRGDAEAILGTRGRLGRRRRNGSAELHVAGRRTRRGYAARQREAARSGLCQRWPLLGDLGGSAFGLDGIEFGGDQIGDRIAGGDTRSRCDGRNADRRTRLGGRDRRRRRGPETEVEIEAITRRRSLGGGDHG